MWAYEPGLASNAISLLSGDQAGLPAEYPEEVIWTGSEPSI
jgi:hypothetical protein